jgi:acyl-coenzyme A thioesterase 13
MAIASWDSRSKTGVSVDINVSYVGVARAGDTVEIEARADKVGGSLGFTSVKISKVVEGRAGPLIATGRHTKFVRQKESSRPL